MSYCPDRRNRIADKFIFPIDRRNNQRTTNRKAIEHWRSVLADAGWHMRGRCFELECSEQYRPIIRTIVSRRQLSTSMVNRPIERGSDRQSNRWTRFIVITLHRLHRLIELRAFVFARKTVPGKSQTPLILCVFALHRTARCLSRR